ncbi:MAG: thioredoxin family protein, partial [Betaproteobacteria bacterium]
VRTEHVEAELVADQTALVPGAPLTVALRLQLAPGWHTYWRNPGDSGLPTTLAWTLPAGVAAGAIEWPAPRALPAGPLVNYGYEGEVLHLVDIASSPTLPTTSPVTLKARAEWLVCKETCIPEGADLALALPVAATAQTDPRFGARIAATRASLPRPLADWQVRAEGHGAEVRLVLSPPTGASAADAGSLRFFPYEPERIEPSRPQVQTRDGSSLVLTLPVSSAPAGGFTHVAGVVAASDGLPASGGRVNAATIDVPLAGTVTPGARLAVPTATFNPGASTAAGAEITLVVALLFAFGGGLLLNLMPCVFPILSLKVLGFATHDDSKATLRAEAVSFAGGVLLTFVVLGFMLAGLRAAGEQLGWGFQLQSPGVVTVLALLFFTLALNLSGVFEFGQLAPSGVAGWSAKNRTLDAFGSGVLAVVIASPCTAPFMGAALGYALSGSVAATLLVFVALGVGMALPYVLLAWFPAWRRRLPRSGPWLIRLKQLLAFPLYATAIWLAWVLGAQRDNDAVLRLLVAMLALGFALWTWRIVRTGGARGWGWAGLVALVAGVTVAAPLLGSGTEAAPARTVAGHDDGWQAYSPAKLAELQAAGRTVFVDFTAAWCVTCQVNKRLVLDTQEMRDAFARGNVALVRADWTRRDAAITQALAALGRNGVPVYAVYRPGQAPRLLPEILQRQLVLDAIGVS